MSGVDWSLVEHFEADEFDWPDQLEPALVYRLDVARGLAEKLALRAGYDYIPRIYITSDVRPNDGGEHGSGEALDISDNVSGHEVSSRWRHFVLQALYAVGFRRVGIYDRHLHLGISGDRDEHVSWQGESQ